MKKNEGLSLIELIVVIAIMGVLASVVGISMAVVSRQNVSNAASDVRGLLQTAQTIAMSKKNCYVEVSKKSNGDWLFETHTYTNNKNDPDDNKVLDRLTISEKVSIKIPSGSNYVDIVSSGSTYTIEYIRNTGAFQSGHFPSEIQFSRGSGSGRKTVTLRLTELTGKVSY